MILSENPLIRAYNSDSLEAMKGMEDNAYELAIVDPEYGIGVNKMNMGSRKTVQPDKRTWDSKPPPESYFTDLFRVSSNQIIWGGNYFDLPPTRGFIVWDKGGSMRGRSFAECEYAWGSFDKSARIFDKNPVQPDRIHVTQKPVDLYRWLLQNYAKKGDRILDTHGGSMSIAIACWELGFDLDIYELDSDYFTDAITRFRNHVKQGRLFEPEMKPKVEQGSLL